MLVTAVLRIPLSRANASVCLHRHACASAVPQHPSRPLRQPIPLRTPGRGSSSAAQSHPYSSLQSRRSRSIPSSRTPYLRVRRGVSRLQTALARIARRRWWRVARPRR
ncbi:hypothetical protein C8J57DRAFT_1309874 [Mycena rebaudengoi]|nr:hypothetical protein C8J57DRAFT_1309874 [Mycena rebaudengoi]